MARKVIGVVELARVCGVSKTTVSAALGGSGRVSEDVRQRIRRTARKLGWRPDPHLAQLMGYLRQSRRGTPTCNLAWLNTSHELHRWRERPWFCGYLSGARRRAEELGYHLDETWTRTPGMNAATLARQLRARGVAGVLLPLPEDQPLLRTLTREEFAWVVIDEAELELLFPRVQADRHGNMRRLLDETSRLGYRKPGLALDPYVDRISQHSYSSAYLGWCRTAGVTPHLTDLPPSAEPETITRFLRTASPDLLIGSDNRLRNWCTSAGRRVPRDIGIAHLNLAADVAGWAGINQNHEPIGAAAVDQLVALLTLRQFAPAPRSTMLIPGGWKTGSTVRRHKPR